MNTETRHFSNKFERLYCDRGVFENFSSLHPISFGRVLPFQSEDAVVDEPLLLAAEEEYLANKSETTRRGVVDCYLKYGLLESSEGATVQNVIDYFDSDFLELMGLLYANAGMFICALRWYRERLVEREAQNPSSDEESVYASIGYCLYGLGLFEEAICWSKSCMGPRALGDMIGRGLIEYEAQLVGGALQVVERSGPRTRYTVSSFEPERSDQMTPRLKSAIKTLAPFQEVYIDWVNPPNPGPDEERSSYPFESEYDGGCLIRHKTNLIFATCAHADALIQKGFWLEAKRLLTEAAMLAPNAEIVQERLRLIP